MEIVKILFDLLLIPVILGLFIVQRYRRKKFNYHVNKFRPKKIVSYVEIARRYGNK